MYMRKLRLRPISICVFLYKQNGLITVNTCPKEPFFDVAAHFLLLVG